MVDDDPSVTASLSLLLRQNGYTPRCAAGPDEAMASLSAGGIDLVLQDMNFSNSTTGREGLDLLARVRGAAPGVPVILITAWGSIALAVEGIRSGAADFITKPWSNAQILSAVETVLSLPDARGAQRDGAKPDDGAPRHAAPAPTRAELESRLDASDLAGEDPAFLRVLELVARVAPTDASVLIMGESGTGKELVAAAIHRNSRRARRPFVKVNLGGISSTLFESEMFGHVRGAFTDAKEGRRGRFEAADGGSIFLDEIGDLEPASQVKLLRVLQDRSYEPLGSSRTRTVDVRVISATNRDLPQMVSQGAFREDLYYRLNLITLRLPALRERPRDIEILARGFLEEFGRTYRRPDLSIAPKAIRWLADQRWPGNVRQLRQTMERAVLILEGSRVEEEDLANLARLEERGESTGGLPDAGSMTLDEIERGMIRKCLAHYEGNLTKVAQALGLSRAALYRRLRRHGLEDGPAGR